MIIFLSLVKSEIGPNLSFKSSSVTAPCLSKPGEFPLKSITVDSSPMLHLPSSITISVKPLRDSSTCSAVVGLTRSFARDLGEYNIRVNSVAPSATDTDMLNQMEKNAKEKLLKGFTY